MSIVIVLKNISCEHSETYSLLRSWGISLVKILRQILVWGMPLLKILKHLLWTSWYIFHEVLETSFVKILSHIFCEVLETSLVKILRHLLWRSWVISCEDLETSLMKIFRCISYEDLDIYPLWKSWYIFHEDLETLLWRSSDISRVKILRMVMSVLWEIIISSSPVLPCEMRKAWVVCIHNHLKS